MSSAQAQTENRISPKPTTTPNRTTKTNQASPPSASTKAASTIVRCDLQSRPWMLLHSGPPIAGPTRTSPTDTWNTATRGTRGEAKTKPMPWPHSKPTKGVTHHEHKRGQSAQLWRGTKYNLLQVGNSADYGVYIWRWHVMSGSLPMHPLVDSLAADTGWPARLG